MDEKIKHEFEHGVHHIAGDLSNDAGIFAESVCSADETNKWIAAFNFYAGYRTGYRAALDALPSRYAIEDAIFANSVQTIYKYGEYLWVVNQGNLLNTIDALIRGKV